jgi:hypothetical protein
MVNSWITKVDSTEHNVGGTEIKAGDTADRGPHEVSDCIHPASKGRESKMGGGTSCPRSADGIVKMTVW